MNNFWPLLSAVRERLADPDSALQQASQAAYGRAAAVHLDRVPQRDASGAAPEVLLVEGDEEVAGGNDRGSLGGLRCVREVGVALTASRLAAPAERLNALLTALIADLHHQPLAGARRVDYAGAGRDDLDGNRVMATAVFRVLYERKA